MGLSTFFMGERGMKKLFSILFVIAMMFSLSTIAHASPTLVQIVFDDFSDFNELRYMEANLTDEQLRAFLRGRSRRPTTYFDAGLTNREEVQEFINTVGQAFIPALSNQENVEWRIEIPRGSAGSPRDEGLLFVRYWFPADRVHGARTIVFRSLYGSGHGSNRILAEARRDGILVERGGVEFYQLLNDPTWRSGFVINIDGYVISARFEFAGTERMSYEEMLEEIQKFSFVRLSDNEEVERFQHATIIAACVIVAVVAMIIVIKRRRYVISSRKV